MNFFKESKSKKKSFFFFFFFWGGGVCGGWGSGWGEAGGLELVNFYSKNQNLKIEFFMVGGVRGLE